MSSPPTRPTPGNLVADDLIAGEQASDHLAPGHLTSGHLTSGHLTSGRRTAKAPRVARTVPLSPSRRTALVIGVPFVIALIAYVSVYYVALAGQDSFPVRKSVAPVAGTITVSVNGDISVTPGVDGRAHLTGVVSYSLFRPTLRWRVTPTQTVLEGPNCYWVGNCSATLALAVPPAQALNLSTSSGNLTVSHLSGDLKLSDDSGDIVVTRSSGALALNDSSGDVTGTQLSGTSARVSNDSGDVDLSFVRAPDDVRVNASSGNVTVSVPANVSYAVSADTSSGTADIGVPTSSSSHHMITIRADSGNISVVPARP
jgi:Putative adhesin